MADLVPFNVKDSALIAMATGHKARNLSELRDRLTIVPQSSIYYHFWCGKMRPHVGGLQYSNDFSMWSEQALHDHILSERLDVIDPSNYKDMDHLRDELLDIIDIRLDEVELVPSAVPKDSFYFVRSNIVIFNTRHVIHHPKQLAEVIPRLSRGSIFYHFIDARRRTEEGQDDITNWLKGLDHQYEELISQIHRIDPYFVTLNELQQRVSSLLKATFLGGVNA